MEKDDIGNRMALGITTILTIMFLLGSLNGNLPKVSYPKALDWYLLVAFSFVFLSLMECMVVYVFTLIAKSDDTQIKYKVNCSLTSLVCFESNPKFIFFHWFFLTTLRIGSKSRTSHSNNAKKKN